MADSDVASPETMVSQLSSDSRTVISTSKYPSPNQACSSLTASSYNVCEVNMTPDPVCRSFNITFKLISPAASSGPFCRICHEGDNHEDLISLCKCTGTVGLVHLTCMEKWLNTRRTGHDKCEICNYTFPTIRSHKSITEWYRSDQGAMTHRNNVLGDLACFSLLTPLAALSTFLCFEGAKKHILWNNSLEAGALMALATFLITVYVIWNVLTIRFHLKNYYKWRSLNQTVRLIRFQRKSTDAGSSVANQRNGINSNEQSRVNSLENPLPESANSNQ